MSFRVSDEKIQEVRERADILQIVGERVPLKKAGIRYTGLCPFHQEKTPSFSVHPGLGLYKCFGCGEGGDVISFMMKLEGRPFIEVVRDLAARFGVSLPEREMSSAERIAETAQKKEREQLLRLNADAMELYHGLYLRDPAARAVREYVAKRALTEETQKRFKLGYAPNAWDVLTNYFTRKGEDLKLAVKAGLLVPRESGTGYYDRFRHRLLFPITGQSGEVLGFGGRQLQEGDGAKYLNSPETPLFHKGRCLYGLHGAAPAARKAGNILVVEGYFDQVALCQAGVENVVATLGTALTEDHAQVLRRLVRDVYVLFDGDEAGVRAAQKSADVLLRAGLGVRVVELPKGEDPDTFVQKVGAEGFRERVAASKPIFDFVIVSSALRAEKTPAGKARCVESFKPLFAHLTNPVEQAQYVNRVADALRLNETEVREALGYKLAPPTAPPPPWANKQAGGKPWANKAPGERDFAPRPMRERQADWGRSAGGVGGGSRQSGIGNRGRPERPLTNVRQASPTAVLGELEVLLAATLLAHPHMASQATDPSLYSDAKLYELVARTAVAYERDGRVDVATQLAPLDDETLASQILTKTLAVSEMYTPAEGAPPDAQKEATQRLSRAVADNVRRLREARLRDEVWQVQRRIAEAAASGDAGLLTQLSNERKDLENRIRGLPAA